MSQQALLYSMDYYSTPSHPDSPHSDHITFPTPATLGWTTDTEYLGLYTFVFMKGREPFFELDSPLVVSERTPQRVYMDQPL